MSMLRAAAAVGMTLGVVEQTLGHPLPFLPPVGGPLAELGLMFAGAYLVVEFLEILAIFGGWLKVTMQPLSGWYRRRARRKLHAQARRLPPVAPAEDGPR